MPQIEECNRRCFRGVVAAMGWIAALLASDALAQDDSVRALAERSSIVVEGKVVRVNASLEPMLATSPSTVVVAVTRMYAGAEIAGDQKGRNITVVLSRPLEGIKAGAEAIFFGNPRFVGKSLTIADEGELPAATARMELEGGLQARRDLPLRERVAIASSIFIGKVEGVRALVAEADRKEESRARASEHDPEWHVAAVRVEKALQGSETGALVDVIFPASYDIMWFNSPKLKPGQEAIFITHNPDREGTRLMREPGVEAFLAAYKAK